MAAKKKPPKTAELKKSRARTPPFKHYPAWSEAKFWAYIRSGLRSTYNKYPVKWEVIEEAKRPYIGDSKQQKWEYQCKECNGWFKQCDISVDHVVPAGSLNSFADLAGFAERLFTSKEGLQLLCTECHKRKTQNDRQNLPKV